MISVLNAGKKDRDIFVKKAESLGAKVFVQSANGNEETQMSQIEKHDKPGCRCSCHYSV